MPLPVFDCQLRNAVASYRWPRGKALLTARTHPDPLIQSCPVGCALVVPTHWSAPSWSVPRRPRVSSRVSGSGSPMQKTYPALRKIDSKVGRARSNPLLISTYIGTTLTLGTFRLLVFGVECSSRLGFQVLFTLAAGMRERQRPTLVQDARRSPEDGRIVLPVASLFSCPDLIFMPRLGHMQVRA